MKIQDPRKTTDIACGLSRRGFITSAAAGVGAFSAVPFGASRSLARTPTRGGILRMGLGGGESTNTLDPAAAISQVSFHAMRAFGESLLDINSDGSIDWRLAESVEGSSDLKTWAFKIRTGVPFHDGGKLTAGDVLATMKRHSDENSHSGALGVMRDIAEMEVDGDMFIVRTTNPSADLPYLLSTYQLVIQPNGGYDDPNAGIGTNAYRVTVDEPGVRYVFERFPDYWDDTRGHFDGVEMIVINDTTSRMAALQAGQVHIANKVDPKIAQALGSVSGVQIRNVSGRGHYALPMQCITPPFDNEDLRMALKLAINRDEMVEKILYGYGSVGNDFPINGAYPLFDDTIPQRQFDPDEAAHYYERSGHDGSPIVLHIAEAAFPSAIDAAALFKMSANSAGIPLEVKRAPDDGYWADVWNKAPFFGTYWGGRPVQDQMYSVAYVSDADWNETRFFDKDFDAMVLQARAETDPEARKAIYSRMAYAVRDRGGLICPMFNDFVEAIRDEVQGWEANNQWEVMNGLAPHKCWFA